VDVAQFGDNSTRSRRVRELASVEQPNGWLFTFASTPGNGQHPGKYIEDSNPVQFERLSILQVCDIQDWGTA
jgi:hypothetical protein